MEEFILLDDFTKDMFGIKEFGVILDLSDDTNSVNKEMYNAFIGLLDKHDIRYEIIRQSDDELYHFRITNYDAGDLRELFPIIVHDDDEKGVDDITIHGESNIISCGTGITEKEVIDATKKYKLYWNRETGFYKMWDWRWDLEGGSGTSGTSGIYGTTGSSGTAGIPPAKPQLFGTSGNSQVIPGKGITNAGTGSANGTSGSSGTSGFGTKDLKLFEKLIKFIKQPIITAKQLKDG